MNKQPLSVRTIKKWQKKKSKEMQKDQQKQH